MYIDKDFQDLPSGTHVGGDGSGIGGVTPTTKYAPQVLPNGALLSTIQSVPAAAQYPTVMTYFERQLLAPAGGLVALSFDAYFDNGGPTVNAFETDLLLTFPGATAAANPKVNNSLQNVQGQLYLTMSNVWVKIPGAAPGLFLPNARYHHVIAYKFTPTSGCILSVAINDQTFEVPLTMQKSDVALVNWTAGLATVQLQQSLAPAGVSFSVLLDAMSLAWQPEGGS